MFAQAPVITSFSPASGQVGSLVTIKGTNLSPSGAVTIGGVNAIVVSSSDTQVLAFVMPKTTTGSITLVTVGGTATGNSNFVISASKPPNKQQGDKLVSSDNTRQWAYQGSATALSANGSTAIVGAGNIYPGQAYIYGETVSGWQQQGSLSGQAGFGYSVAISADGSTAIIGCPYIQNTSGDQTGSAFVYKKSKAGAWSLQGSLSSDVANNNPSFYGYQGNAVGISADGNTAVVGGQGLYGPGGVCVYIRDFNGNWSQQGSILSDPNGKAEGWSVAISADAKTIVAGSPFAGSNGTVQVYTRGAGGVWQQQGSNIVPTDVVGAAYFGFSVAVSADGSTIAAGGARDAYPSGAVWAFTKNNSGVWVQQGSKLVGSGASGNHPYQGTAVGISADGNTIIEAGNDDDFTGKAAAWVFTRTNNIWAQAGAKLSGSNAIEGDEDVNQLVSVAISSNGNVGIIGSPDDNSQVGAAWIFADSAFILPVNFANISAYSKNKGVQVEWDGLNEINLARYEVERASVGQNFIKLGNVAAKNTAQSSYNWFDATPLEGDNYYRIKAVSKDASVQYSRIVKINIGAITSSILVSPNPAISKKIRIQFNNIKAGTYAIAAYNASGQQVAAGTYVHDGSSINSITIGNSQLAAGVYKVVVTNGSVAYKATATVQ